MRILERYDLPDSCSRTMQVTKGRRFEISPVLKVYDRRYSSVAERPIHDRIVTGSNPVTATPTWFWPGIRETTERRVPTALSGMS
jgi:hypothetical protein